MKRILLSIALCFYCTVTFGQNPIRKIEKAIRGKQASIGIAILCGDKTFTIANDKQYPIMSVFKLPIAVAALKKMEIEYTVAHSDNNTCDWLIEFAGGINNIDAYMKSLGIEDLNLTETEHDMHVNIMNCYNNWSTPLSIARLLKKIYTENVLTEEHFAFLEKTMLDCSSGKDKLKAGLPAGIPLAHKTGHSDRMPDGLQISDADAGVIYLPDGEKCFLVVLIKDSRETDRDNAGIMADIAGITYRSLQKRHLQKPM